MREKMPRLNFKLCVRPLLFFALACIGCKQQYKDTGIKLIDPVKTARLAASVESVVKPVIADRNLSMSLWGIDSLVISPIAIDIDDNGDLYYVTTNRQKNSE